MSIVITSTINPAFIKPVHAYTNQWTKINDGSCGTCTNPRTTTSGNIVTQNDLLLLMIECATGGTVTGIIDSKSINSWTLASQRLFGPNHDFYTTTHDIEYWYEGAGANTGAITETISWAGIQTSCIISMFEGNTAFVAFSNDFTASNINSATVAVSIGTTVTLPSNSIMFATQLIYYNVSSNFGSSAIPQLPMQQPTTYIPAGGGGCGNACQTADFASYYITGSTPSSLTVSWTLTTTAQPYTSRSTMFIAGVIFSTGGTTQVSQSSVSQNGCQSTFTPTGANAQFGIGSNRTYWFPLYTAGAQAGTFFTPTNITLWISKINLQNGTIGDHQTKVDVYVLVFISGLTNIVQVPQGGLPSPTTPWPIGLFYPPQSGNAVVGQTVLLSIYHYTNTTAPFKISMSQNSFKVPQGDAYAIGLYATHNGVHVVKCATSPPQMYDSGTVYTTIIANSGFNINFCSAQQYCLANINSATTSPVQPYIYALIQQPQVTIIQTSTNVATTVTQFFTVTSTTTTGVATTTVTQTTTIVTNALQGTTGSIQIMNNLITYLPLWMLPLMFGAVGGAFGFGTGGLLMGLMFALVLAQLDGQIPLWTVFIDIIMIYVLLRR